MNFKHCNTELELAEYFASLENLIDSEDALKERWRDYLLNCFDVAALVDLMDDEPAQSELFNNWMDGLQTAGELHASQVNAYGMPEIDFLELAKEKARA